MIARATGNGRRTLLNREYTERQRDGTALKRTLATPDELLAVLAEGFDLHFPAGTRFGSPGAPWPV
jgi:N-hydroxyarylamine O-acetyltransferase